MALEAARALLVEGGPQAVTLKAVASRVNRTHANLLHHFGSAGGLQRALADYLATIVCAEISEAVVKMQSGVGDARQTVDLVFDAFGSQGGGQLAAWMLSSGHSGALDPILDAVHQLIDKLMPNDLTEDEVRARRELTYSLVLMALGESLLGAELASSLSVDRDAARSHGEEMIDFAFARYRAA